MPAKIELLLKYFGGIKPFFKTMENPACGKKLCPNDAKTPKQMTSVTVGLWQKKVNKYLCAQVHNNPQEGWVLCAEWAEEGAKIKQIPNVK